MKILVVGSGGREHALCHFIAKSPHCSKLYCIPGNAGIAADAECLDVAVNDVPGIVAACRSYGIDFVVVGPDAQLEQGLADAIAEIGLPCFGPSRAAAEIEWSKGFMKDLCARQKVPTAAYRRFDKADEAHAYVREMGAPIVIKADGLAAGKGVTVAQSIEEADAAIDAAMVDQIFGASGSEVVIEEFMAGEEASFFVLSDGKTAKFFTTAQDHKAVFDGDKGPNTGGMGAYSPAPVVDAAMIETVMQTVALPTLNGLKDMGRPFAGILYVGLMIAKGKPRVVEFNSRFGDPEAQVMIPRLKTDIVDVLLACANATLDKLDLQWKDEKCLTVVMATKGYPGAYEKGSVIRGLADANAIPSVVVLHAGTKLNGKGDVTANGGRVLCVTATAPTVVEAQKRAYEAVDKIDWPEGFCRRDIGWRAVAREQK